MERRGVNKVIIFYRRGMTNNFVINDKDIGDLECIQLSIDGRDGFMFESVSYLSNFCSKK